MINENIFPTTAGTRYRMSQNKHHNMEQHSTFRLILTDESKAVRLLYQFYQGVYHCNKLLYVYMCIFSIGRKSGISMEDIANVTSDFIYVIPIIPCIHSNITSGIIIDRCINVFNSVRTNACIEPIIQPWTIVEKSITERCSCTTWAASQTDS